MEEQRFRKELQWCIYEKKGRVAYVTLNRPEAMNAISPEVSAELSLVWQDFKDDPDSWVAILTGAGEKAFCTGADIKWMAQHRGELPTVGPESPAQRFGGLVRAQIFKPIIAAVNGYCLGGGLELALACDIVVAAEHAGFGFPEVRNVGRPPGSGGTIRLPRQIPMKLAMEMLLTGERISAQEAYRRGLVNHVVPMAELMPTAERIAQQICQNSPMAVQATKEYALRSLDLPLEHPFDAWQLHSEITFKLFQSEDRKSDEGPAAFVEKRTPDWKGR